MSGRWPRVSLGQVLSPVERPESVEPTREYRMLGVRWYGEGLFERERLLGQEIKAPRVYRVEQGDFVYNRLFAWKGSFAIASGDVHGAFVSNEFPCFASKLDQVLPEYLRWWFAQEKTWLSALGLSSGATPTSRNRLKEKDFLTLEIPLPPLAEQRRVVRRVDAAARSIGEAQKLRSDVDARAAALADSLANAMFSKLSAASLKRPLGECAQLQSGVTLGRELKGRTIRLPYLRVANVQAGRLDLSNVKEIEVYEHEAEKWLLQDGDILLTEGGDWDKLGRGTVWRDEITNCIHQNHIFRLRVNPAEFDPDFLAAYISSPIGKAYFQVASKQTTNLASINQRQLRAFPVPVLALERQREIVKELGAVQALVAEAAPRTAEIRQQLDALLPAILDRAFADAR